MIPDEAQRIEMAEKLGWTFICRCNATTPMENLFGMSPATKREAVVPTIEELKKSLDHAR